MHAQGRQQFVFRSWQEMEITSGVRTYGMLSRVSMGTREVRQIQVEPVGSNKLARRE